MPISLAWIQSLAIFLAVSSSLAEEPRDLQDEKTASFERGVRLRAYRIERPHTRTPRLAPDQSANVDLTIPHFNLQGDEPFIAKTDLPVLVQLECRFEADKSGEYEFRLVTAGPASLLVGAREFISSGKEQGPQALVRLEKGPTQIECTAVFTDSPPKLELLSRRVNESELTPIAPERLTAQTFYFRPTSPGVKQLARDQDRPGLHEKVEGVHPSFDLATIHEEGTFVPVGGLDVMGDGTLVVATFDARRLHAPRPQNEPDGELWLYHGAEGDPTEIRRERIAEGLFEPCGVCVVGDSIYVSQRLEVTRFGRVTGQTQWRATTVASGWQANDFHALSFGLLHEPAPGNHPGFLYMAKGTGLGLQENPPNHGSVWRIDLSRPADENVEAITGGHRTPNGLGWGPAGTMFVTDNQGEFTAANELNLVQDGAFYGFFHRIAAGAEPTPFQPGPTRQENRRAVTEATVWLPPDEIANSPSEPVMIPHGWPFAGQLLVGDVKYGGINRICLEQVDGVWQGCAFRFTQGLEGGINRLAFGPGGSLFAGAIGGDHAATWNWVDPNGRKTYQGLQRLRPNGSVAFDIESVQSRPGGFLVQFTKPVSVDSLTNAETYQVEQWTYRATPEYGGPKVDGERLDVVQVQGHPDGRSVLLQVDGVKRDRVVHLTMDPISRSGERLWSCEAWFTVRRQPDSPEPKPTRVVFVTGDDEYGSEVSMPMLASILERTPGFEVRVLRTVDEEGQLDCHGQSIPGLRALRDADLAVFFMRFRALPDAQVQEIEDYVASGKPVIGLRTATHAFRYEEGPHQHLNDGFGDAVLGQRWISHYGHGTTSMAEVDKATARHPILRGIPDKFALSSWLYVIATPERPLPENCQMLLTGIALHDAGEKSSRFGERQPLAWTRELETSRGRKQRVFYTSLGHPHDFLEEPSRRLLINAIYWALGRESEIAPSGANAPLPDGYDPSDPQ